MAAALSPFSVCCCATCRTSQASTEFSTSDTVMSRRALAGCYSSRRCELRRHDAGERMAGRWAQSATTVWLGGEVTAVAIFAV